MDKLPDTEKLTPPPEKDKQPVPDAPKPANTVANPPAPAPTKPDTSALDDYKMMAEPLKDTGEESVPADDEATQDFSPISDDTIDKVISMRPDAMQHVPDYEKESPVVQKEGQMEGRDTLLPDQ